jgi:hypothetical protein
MIDIFVQPKLYIADIEIEYKRKNPAPRKGRYNKNLMVYEKQARSVLRLSKQPVLLINNDFPSNKYKGKFLEKFSDRYIGKFEELSFKVTFSNIKYSSEINYYFDLED